MEIYQIFKKGSTLRHSVFKDVLSKLGKGPAKILEIGVLRDLSEEAMGGDGWSSLHLAEHIEKYGGQLVQVDIDQKSMDASNEALKSFKIKKSTFIEDGLDILKSCRGKINFDLILLDGNDNPIEMLRQMDFAEGMSRYILCDDYHTKGVMVDHGLGLPRVIYKLEDADHEMALFGEGIKENSEIIIEL